MSDNDIWVLFIGIGGIWILLMSIKSELEKITDLLEKMIEVEHE